MKGKQLNKDVPRTDLDEVAVELRRVRIRADLLQPFDDVRLLRQVLLLLLAPPRSCARARGRSRLLQARRGSTRRGLGPLPPVAHARRRLERQISLRGTGRYLGRLAGGRHTGVVGCGVGGLLARCRRASIAGSVGTGELLSGFGGLGLRKTLGGRPVKSRCRRSRRRGRHAVGHGLGLARTRLLLGRHRRGTLGGA